MSLTSEVFATHHHMLADGRRLGYSQVGPASAPDVLLCLPGLLETRHTFDPVLRAAEASSALRVIGLDHCGRGDSDPLPGDQGYAMAQYLEDALHFIRQQLLANGTVRLHVLGTSMGGILAMYLTAEKSLPVQTLLLNDIGLSFYWVSIYGLYDGMKKKAHTSDPDQLAAELRVTPGALRAVQSPTHFNLPYKKDWKGMHFAQLLSSFAGELRLVHGAESAVCLADQVRELQKRFPAAQVLEVPHAKHPAPFNDAVCAFVLSGVSQAEAPMPLAQPVEVASSTASSIAFTPAFAPAFAPTFTPASASASPPTAEAPVAQSPTAQAEALHSKGLWSWLKRRLG